MDKTFRQKINEETEDFNTINKLDLREVYRTLQSRIEEYTFLLSVCGTSSGNRPYATP